MPAEIKVLALQSPQIVINELAADFEQRTGYRVRQLLDHAEMPIHIEQRINAGEAFDAAFLVPAALDRLAEQGKIVGGTWAHFLRVPIGVAVRSGLAKPEIGSVEAFKRALLEAKSIAYLMAGTSGPYLQTLFERLGIAAELQAKSHRPETDTVGDLVAQGDADMGITAIATLRATRGVDVVGPIPSAIQSYVCFEGAVSANTILPKIARDLIEYLTGPSALHAIKLNGMESW
jgi:molybdate transport system substrate-binding protein